jgi:hypothetical protein
MGRAGKIAAIVIVTIVLLIIWNAVTIPAINAPMDQKKALCDKKLKILDQAAIALDKGDQSAYDQLQAQADSITGC